MRPESPAGDGRRTLSPSENAELLRLRAAVFGRRDSGGASGEDIAALEALETRARGGALQEAPAAQDDGVESVEQSDDETEPSGAAVRGGGSRSVRTAAIIAGAVLLTGGAFWGGAAVATQSVQTEIAAQAQTGPGLPEFAEAQTDEDLLPPAFVQTAAAELDLDPASSRFVASVDGISIFLVLMSGSQENICVIAIEGATSGGTFQGLGCEGGTAAGGAGNLGTPLSPTLWLQMGTPSEPVIGHPLKLSESVTVYRR